MSAALASAPRSVAPPRRALAELPADVQALRGELVEAVAGLPAEVPGKDGGRRPRAAFLVLLHDWALDEPGREVGRLRQALAKVAAMAAGPAPEAPPGGVSLEQNRPSGQQNQAAPEKSRPSFGASKPKQAPGVEAPRGDVAPKPNQAAPALGEASSRRAPDPLVVDPDPWRLKEAAAPVSTAPTCACCSGPAAFRAPGVDPTQPLWCAGCVADAQARAPKPLQLEVEARMLVAHLDLALAGLPDEGRAAYRASLLGAVGHDVARLREAVSDVWKLRGDADARIDALAARLGLSWAPTIWRMRYGSPPAPLWHVMVKLTAEAAKLDAGDAAAREASCPCGAPAVFYDSIAGQMQRLLCRPCAEAAGYKLEPVEPAPAPLAEPEASPVLATCPLDVGLCASEGELDDLLVGAREDDRLSPDERRRVEAVVAERLAVLKGGAS